MTQSELGTLIGKSQKTVERYENPNDKEFSQFVYY